MKKTCPKCNKLKDINSFYKSSNTCKLCDNEKNRKWRLKNPEREREIHNKWYYNNREEYLAKRKIKDKKDYKDHKRYIVLKCKYGIEKDVYQKMLLDQDYSCAICNTHVDKYDKNLSVDHNHNTSEVRGLLCSNCNSALGLFSESIDVLQSAIKYLERNNYATNTSNGQVRRLD